MLAQSIERILVAPEAQQRVDDIAAAISLAEASGRRLLNRVFVVGVVFVVVVLIASLVKVRAKRRPADRAAR